MDNYQEEYYFADLIFRDLKDELSPVEKKALNEWLAKNTVNKCLLEEIKNESNLKSEIKFLNDIDEEAAWKALVIAKNKMTSKPKLYLFATKWKYAAIAILVLATSVLTYKYNKTNDKNFLSSTITKRFKNDVSPGKEGAVLTLANGKQITLTGSSSTDLTRFKSPIVVKKNGWLVFNQSASSKNGLTSLTTPKGFKYKIKLADGSLVWLNASSTLKFSSSFHGKTRNVYLSGEAYFEVAKNKRKPFKVYSDGNVVQVLGTHFNIKAYKDENVVKATLLEGSIKISSGAKTKMVLPGQQASIIHNNRNISITKGSIDESVAWKNDMFVFDNEGTQDVMRKISRWYNVEVDYKGEIPETHFTGKISRENNISQILNMLELTGGVHFKIENRKIIVTQ